MGFLGKGRGDELSGDNVKGSQCRGRVSDRGRDPKKRGSRNTLFEKKTNLSNVELMVMEVI